MKSFSASLLERLKKYCGHSERGFLGFGEASVREQGQSNPVTEPKRSQNPKRPLLSSIQPDGYSISLNALPGWDGTEDQAFDAKLRVLTKFNQNLAILRRTNHSAARLKMEQAPFEREEQRLVAEAAREEERLALLVVGRIP